jgi:homogentisate 1,2-dioxygenase
MPIYHTLGEIPRKRHTQFRRLDGTLYHEELFGSEGFSGPYSLLYHLRPPTQVRGIVAREKLEWRPGADSTLRHRHMRTSRIEPKGDPIFGRHVLLYNRDVAISIAVPDREQDFLYRNGQGDELVYVSEGAGTLESSFGEIRYGPGDYVVIPRGTIHRWRMDGVPHRMLAIESAGPVRPPRRYRSLQGQLLEHSPYCERDIRRPNALVTRDETGDFEVMVKQKNGIFAFTYAAHPFDLVGWDGYLYPWTLSIHDFEPITGRIHQPPPVHQTFEAEGFVICSFVPRLYDYHPDAIPVPYNHTNAGTDEVIYYASGEFMSRRGIEYGSITLHPDGIPHGPHPGTVEASLGKKSTNELAVMIDTMRPLHVSQETVEIDDPDYPGSWLP